jgi:hypothetical protein
MSHAVAAAQFLHATAHLAPMIGRSAVALGPCLGGVLLSHGMGAQPMGAQQHARDIA